MTLLLNLLNRILYIFGRILTKNEIAELCKGVTCVDLGESFQTHIDLQNLASMDGWMDESLPVIVSMWPCTY